MLGFFTWRWIVTLGLDHMYSAPIFLGMLALLAASLMACTYTTQIPLVKVARRSVFFLPLLNFATPCVSLLRKEMFFKNKLQMEFYEVR